MRSALEIPKIRVGIGTKIYFLTYFFVSILCYKSKYKPNRLHGLATNSVQAMNRTHSQRKSKLKRHCRESKVLRETVNAAPTNETFENILWNYHFKLAYCPIPKTGTSSWKKIFASLEGIFQCPKTFKCIYDGRSLQSQDVSMKRIWEFEIKVKSWHITLTFPLLSETPIILSLIAHKVYSVKVSQCFPGKNKAFCNEFCRKY